MRRWQLNRHLPNDKVIVMVVNDGRDAAVGVNLQIFWSFLFLLAEVKIDGFVRQVEFFKNEGNFPESQVGREMHSKSAIIGELTSRSARWRGCTK